MLLRSVKYPDTGEAIRTFEHAIAIWGRQYGASGDIAVTSRVVCLSQSMSRHDAVRQGNPASHTSHAWTNEQSASDSSIALASNA